VVPETSAGRLFRDELGRLNRRLAQESDRVLIVVAGRLLTSGAGLPGSEVGAWPGTGFTSTAQGPQ
jgi:adenosylcobinamide kinase/adenosylcobinamide-phosphate guanylyltransferase